jgi:hypothetical protein
VIAARLAVVAVLLGGGLLGGAACKGKGEAPSGEQRPAPIGAPERQRGADACKSYLARACACAKAHPDNADIKKRCDLDVALPDAMNLALGIDDEPQSTPEDIFRAQGAVRKVISTCVEGANWLSTHGCP